MKKCLFFLIFVLAFSIQTNIYGMQRSALEELKEQPSGTNCFAWNKSFKAYTKRDDPNKIILFDQQKKQEIATIATKRAVYFLYFQDDTLIVNSSDKEESFIDQWDPVTRKKITTLFRASQNAKL